MVVCDVFSRYAWTIPLSGKTAGDVVDGFKQLFAMTDRRCSTLISDKGKEFDNKSLLLFLKQNDIRYYHTNNPQTKCSIAERFIRTLRLMLQKVFTFREKYRYVDGLLDDVTFAYNNKIHRTLTMTPTQASDPKRLLEVYHILYDKKLHKQTRKIKFKVGDYVRISREKKKFEKAQTWNWSEEIFKVSKVISQIQPLYKLVEIDKEEEIEGNFYEWELSKVTKPELFKIAYIVSTKGKGDKQQKLVHWRGYPEASRSWILSKDIVNM